MAVTPCRKLPKRGNPLRFTTYWIYLRYATFREDNPVLNCDECWKEVVGFEGLYRVSNYGCVMSTGAYIKSRKGKLLRANPSTTSAYLYVKLWKDNKMRNRSVHSLVAEAFVDNPEGKPMVNHIDGNKLNNHASNLEWVTCSENHRHAFTTGLRNAEHVRQRQLGVKFGRSSKYNNVSWDNTRHRWKAAVKHNGKPLGQKRFVSEEAAAAYVNKLLDEHGLTDRPRNIIT